MSVRAPSPPLNYDYSVVTAETDQSATLLLDAKNEYNKQLVSHLRQPVFNLMKSIYNGAENICHQENTPENILMVYQDNLAQVPKWPKTRRSKEYEEFLKISKCDWFNELIKFTYVTHVKILTIVNKIFFTLKITNYICMVRNTKNSSIICKIMFLSFIWILNITTIKGSKIIKGII